MLTKILVIVFFIYVLQSTLAWLQIKRSYKVINDVRAQHRGSNCRMVTGTGRTSFLFIAKGYFVILVVDPEDTIVDYYGMDGYTVFATPKHKPEHIGKSLDELLSSFTKKNEIKAVHAAREQLSLLRERELVDSIA